VNARTKSTAEVAYELWETRGRPHGSADEDWLAAERLAAHSEALSDCSSEKVEEALVESFPASDPPAHLTPDVVPSNAEAKWAAARQERPARR